ncbi:FMN reductase [Paenibacillus sp. J23TS9]|uniref:NADPH-dependent FMN reductase n=1 Tax=Paenibacillus sp. J23TS9 TaxID=2807193 RepID=UPI001B20E7B2|nr:NAD(P)H-dependent oxidoreductase [Paenibacillus sp. J23TS9]GIP25050.1 FMN reductase [Paenibacillus sp. J23TS9]
MNSTTVLNIVGISGSLRNKSSNTNLLRALSELAPENMKISIFDGIGDLPHFNPELDDEPPASVTRFREQMKEADGLIISTPEYAHGIPGVLKNALDWLVPSGELYEKPLMVLSASPLETGGEKAHDSLLLTLLMMTARITPGGSLCIPFINKKINTEYEVSDELLREKLMTMLNQLGQAAKE